LFTQSTSFLQPKSFVYPKEKKKRGLKCIAVILMVVRRTCREVQGTDGRRREHEHDDKFVIKKLHQIAPSMQTL